MIVILGNVNSYQSLGTKDGPGIRFVVFMQGCPKRCIWCHNPETLSFKEAISVSSSELCDKIARCKPYFKNGGGVTFTGGEPLCQSEFLCEIIPMLQEKGIHVAIETAGVTLNENVVKCLEMADLVMFDIKAFSEEKYSRLCSSRYSEAINFLDTLQSLNKEVLLRYLIVEGHTDSVENLTSLKEIEKNYSCIKKVELLGFRKLGLEKYEKLGLPFLLTDTPETTQDKLKKYKDIYNIL